MSKRNYIKDYIKRARKLRREEEIRQHNKVVSIFPTHIKETKKIYKRNKKVKLDD